MDNSLKQNKRSTFKSVLAIIALVIGFFLFMGAMYPLLAVLVVCCIFGLIIESIFH